jgi:hypothetical protein
MKAKIYLSVHCPGCDLLMVRTLDNRLTCDFEKCEMFTRYFDYDSAEIELREVKDENKQANIF